MKGEYSLHVIPLAFSGRYPGTTVALGLCEHRMDDSQALRLGEWLFI